jgi:leucine-zipper of insertion element IS481
MGLHGNAKLGPAGRRAMVLLVVVDRLSQRAAAARCGVGKTTVKRWVDRYEEASDGDRRSGRCFCDRSSRPQTSPRQVPPAEAERICQARQRTGWGPRLIAGRPVIHTRLCGAAFVGLACRDHPAQRGKRRAGMSGRVRETCCTSTRNASPDSPGRGTLSPAIGTRLALRSVTGSAMNGCTRSSTTTRDWPTASCTETRRPRP